MAALPSYLPPSAASSKVSSPFLPTHLVHGTHFDFFIPILSDQTIKAQVPAIYGGQELPTVMQRHDPTYGAYFSPLFRFYSGKDLYFPHGELYLFFHGDILTKNPNWNASVQRLPKREHVYNLKNHQAYYYDTEWLAREQEEENKEQREEKDEELKDCITVLGEVVYRENFKFELDDLAYVAVHPEDMEKIKSFLNTNPRELDVKWQRIQNKLFQLRDRFLVLDEVCFAYILE